MNRYTITENGIVLHLYYETLEVAKQKHPNAIIEPYVDTSYIFYAEKIKALSDPSMGWWKIPYGAGYIAYRQYKDKDGYLDGCEYIRYDHHSCTVPLTRTITDPKSFFNQFFNEDMLDGEHGFKRLSQRQFDKLKGKAKPIKFCTIGGTAWYVDGYGNFFEHITSDTGKNSVKEWNKFRGNKDAVFGQIWYGIHGNYSLQWYSNMEEFKKDFDEKVGNTPTWAATPRYEIKIVGYKKKHPYDRENYIRLSYYPITKIPNNKRNIIETAVSWAKIATNIEYYRKGMPANFETVIKKYWEYIDSAS